MKNFEHEKTIVEMVEGFYCLYLESRSYVSKIVIKSGM